MKYQKFKEIAQTLDREVEGKRSELYFRNTMAWFTYLGLLRQNMIEPKRVEVSLIEALCAAELEPRIHELLPAIMVCLPEALKFKPKDVPADLKAVVLAIKKRRTLIPYKGIKAEKYMRWLNAEAMTIAKRKILFRTKPRLRKKAMTEVGEFVRNSRMKLALTQDALAKKVGVSVRIVRDLEQGRMSASLENVNKILSAFSSRLTIS